jgi:D-alanine-D-alanine ligase
MNQPNPLDPQSFGKVAVLMGGWSAERQVSLWSGEAVLSALKSAGVDAHSVDATPEILLNLKSQGFDRAFNVLHGTGGEDGTVQAVLDLQGIPYTGSGVMACALAMDKIRSKQVWQALGLPVPAYRYVNSLEDAEAAAQVLAYPLVIKPSEEGSSVGVSIVKEHSQIAAAYALAQGAGRTVMAEQFISTLRPDTGLKTEYTCAVLQTESGLRALPVIRIEPDSEFYDFHAKYISENTHYHCPAGLPERLEREVRELALQAFQAVGAKGWGRIDFLIDPHNRPYVLEANLVPGMTSHSLVPMAAKAVGLDFAALCLRILAGCTG